MTNLPTLEDVHAAAVRLGEHHVRTPLLEHAGLNARVGGRVLLKCENLQRTGSFKFRGAFNALSVLAERSPGVHVVASSSGNHAQGVAAAARHFDLPATIVMPSDAPEAKKRGTRALGAEVVEYDRQSGDRDAVAADILARTNGAMVHPFENTDVIAGQGTVGLEIFEQCREAGVEPDAMLVCTGGGGLTAGIVLALRPAWPGIAIHTVEPEGFDDQARSHATGERVGNTAGHSICDAILTPAPGEMSFKLCHGTLAPGLTVSDDDVLQAVAFAARDLKLVVEPGGAVALAAILSGKVQTAGRTIIATLSGGNIDDAMLARALEL